MPGYLVMDTSSSDDWRVYPTASFRRYTIIQNKPYAIFRINNSIFILTRDELEARRDYLRATQRQHDVTSKVLRDWPTPKIKVTTTRKGERNG